MARPTAELARVRKLWPLAETIGIELPDVALAAEAKEANLQQALADTSAAIAALPTEAALVEELVATGGPTPAYRKKLAAVLSDKPLLEAQHKQLVWAVETGAERRRLGRSWCGHGHHRRGAAACLGRHRGDRRRTRWAARRIPWRDFDAAMFSEDEAVRQAFVAIKQQSVRYAALRDAQDLLYADAHDDRFSEMRNLREVWPGYAARGPGTSPAPWANMTGPERLSWLVNEAGADLWVPTYEQLEAAQRVAVEAAEPKKVRATGIFGGI